MLSSSLSFVDGSVVNVALPMIAGALGRSPAAEAWVIDAYLLPLSALLLLGGGAGDRFGRDRLLMLGVAVFGIGSVLCGFAPNYAALLGFRAVQGVGAAILLPNSLAVLSATFEGEARGRAVGAWSAVGAGAAAVGPVLGGWLADTFGWRAIFFVNVPVAAAALALA
ncbi:MAG: MFS transporter, partial [Caulobacteraceae bacterium]|nr:MFS transporter [Caulobacter sp.]